jgi:menaquinone-dependent protoporphyrinogen oxidase
MFDHQETSSGDRVLVAFPTQYGSTEQVSEEIGASLLEHQFDVDVRPMNDVVTLQGYRAVVVGAPFYLGGWHGDAESFLDRLQAQLVLLPVAVFALGPIAENDDLAEAREQLDNALQKYPWLIPIASEMFGGKYDPAKLRFVHKLLTLLPASPLHGLEASDLRDWGAIRTWADMVATRLEPGAPSTD